MNVATQTYREEVYLNDSELEHLKCSVCLEILHDPVSMVPCQHNLCNGCYKAVKNISSCCPLCKQHVVCVGRNLAVCEIVSAVKKYKHLSNKSPNINLANATGNDLHNKNTRFESDSNTSKNVMHECVGTLGPKNINARNDKGQTLIMRAATFKNPLLIQKLVNMHADVNMQDTNKRTALFHATCSGLLASVTTLLQSRADPNLADAQTLTPMICAGALGHSCLISCLVQNGACVDAKDVQGRNALIFAARYGHVKTVKELLAHHADVTLETQKNKKAVCYAMRYGHAQCASLLESFAMQAL
jgi:ankyrin repeat protein